MPTVYKDLGFISSSIKIDKINGTETEDSKGTLQNRSEGVNNSYRMGQNIL